MDAMVLREPCEIEAGGESRKSHHLPLKNEPLDFADLPLPSPGPQQVLLEISACGVCHTEIDEIEGRLPPPHFPVVPGHEIVGRVQSLGPGADKWRQGDRVGVAWIYSSCGLCNFCQRGNENLCDQFKATGLDTDGGYAQFTVVPQDFIYPIPASFADSQAAPLLCAGVIGYRALRLSGSKHGDVLGLYGFGASAHIAIQVARHWGITVFVFTREGQKDHQALARRLGADWVGVTGEEPPRKLRSAIDFTPVGEPVREALKALEKGGRVVINAIRKINPIPELDYAKYVWHEREIKSVANVTRKDAIEFLPLAAEVGIKPELQEFELRDANRALVLLKQGKIQGAAVLRISH
jgi:alcohol dehydrogenase, propanol-preferring